ncbi:MAG: hypothetical protein ACYSTX_04865, partial [Planctomycetota bacterium]
MKPDYSIKLCCELEENFQAQKLYRPLRIKRYEPGTELEYDVEIVGGNVSGKVHLVIEEFIGGGYAGQVYKVRITSIDAVEESLGPIKVGNVYAMKILVPPSTFSRL